MNALQIRFTRTDGGYTVGVESPAAGEASGAFEPPFAGIARRAVMRALEPRPFDPQRFSDGEREALADLGLLRGSRLVSRFHLQVGQRVYDALAAGPEVQTALHVTLTTAAAKRQPLLTELRFMQGAHDLTGLPWELLCREGHFLVRETRLALTRWLGEAIPPTQATGGLPLRLLLVTSRPAGAVPLDPVAERRALLHGLRALQEEAAVVVDNLRPPTSEVLVEAVRGGGYHALHFDGHGGFGLLCPDCDTLNTPESAVCRQCGVELEGEEPAGYLLFEDEYGGPELVAADELRPTLRNSDVRLAVLSACQSGAVGAGEEVWSGVAPALLEAGVPLVVGMQVSVPANAAAVFARQFYATLARGEPLTTAVAEGRLPLAKRRYRNAWFIPALYGRVRGDVGPTWDRQECSGDRVRPPPELALSGRRCVAVLQGESAL
jgi:hypothetical protein